MRQNKTQEKYVADLPLWNLTSLFQLKKYARCDYFVKTNSFFILCSISWLV